jgi:hypothetical protein
LFKSKFHGNNKFYIQQFKRNKAEKLDIFLNKAVLTLLYKEENASFTTILLDNQEDMIYHNVPIPQI